MSTTPRWTRPAGIAATVFGLLTLFAGGVALFGGRAAQAAAGDAVPFVLWFNFLAGFAYIAGGVALYARHRTALGIAVAIAFATAAVYAALVAAAGSGTAFEWRTVGAMAFRTAFWLAIAVALWRSG